MGGCVAFNHNKKKRTCQLLKLKYKKAKNVCSGRLSQKPGLASFRYNKEAKSLAPLKKFKMPLPIENDYCQEKCQKTFPCVAFNINKNTVASPTPSDALRTHAAREAKRQRELAESGVVTAKKRKKEKKEMLSWLPKDFLV